jgi:hypothetical protein
LQITDLNELSEQIVIEVQESLKIASRLRGDPRNQYKDLARGTSLLVQSAEKLAKLKKTLETKQDRENFSNWYAGSKTDHMFSVLKGRKFLRSQKEALKLLDQGYRTITMIGSRRSGKTEGIGALFFQAIYLKYLERLKNGDFWVGWLNYEKRKKEDPFLNCLCVAPSRDLTSRMRSIILDILTISGLFHEIYDDEISNQDEYWLRGGIRILFRTGKKPEQLKSNQYHVVWIDEAVTLEQRSWTEALAIAVAAADGICLASSTIKKGITKEHFFLREFIQPGLDCEHFGYDEKNTSVLNKTLILKWEDNNLLPIAAQKRMETEIARMPKWVKSQEIDSDWRILHDRIYEEAQSRHIISVSEYSEGEKIIDELWGVLWGLDVGGGNAETALIVVGCTTEPWKEDCKFCILESDGIKEYPLLSHIWIDLSKKLKIKYGNLLKYVIFDYAAEPEVKKWARDVEISGLKLVRAIKDIEKGINYVKYLFEQDKISIVEQGNQKLIDNLGINQNSEEIYSWVKDSNGERTNKTGEKGSDLCDAMRYVFYTGHLLKQAKKALK